MKKYVLFVLVFVLVFVLGFVSSLIVEDYFPQLQHRAYSYHGNKVNDAINSFKENELGGKANATRITAFWFYSQKEYQIEGLPIDVYPLYVCEYACWDGTSVYAKLIRISPTLIKIVRISESQFTGYCKTSN